MTGDIALGKDAPSSALAWQGIRYLWMGSVFRQVDSPYEW